MGRQVELFRQCRVYRGKGVERGARSGPASRDTGEESTQQAALNAACT
jgi:hypothetical protein